MQSISMLLVVALLSACGSDEAKPLNDGGSGDFDGGPGDHDAALEIDEESRVAQYIRSTTFSKLVVEIDSVAGSEPRIAAENNVIAQLAGILDKPGGVVSVHDGVLSSRGEDHAWTDEELFALADETFDLGVDDQTIKMHILFVDGHSARDTNSGIILGLAWSNTHLTIFKESIEKICKGPLTPPLLQESLCESAEFSIWIHELGHVLGLVNTGLAMVNDHEDLEHRAHDVSDECVMYWAYEGEAVVTQLRDQLIGGNEELLGFDDECLADIAAVRMAR